MLLQRGSGRERIENWSSHTTSITQSWVSYLEWQVFPLPEPEDSDTSDQDD